MALFQKKPKRDPIPGLIGEAQDYSIYIPTIKEKILWFIVGMIVSGAVLYLF